MTAPDDIIGIPRVNAPTLWLTRRELDDAGWRVTQGPGGQIVGQFALCRDRSGRFVYPHVREADESSADVVRRCRMDRERMEGATR